MGGKRVVVLSVVLLLWLVNVGVATGSCGNGSLALRFDGDDLVTIPNTSALNPSEITIECWVSFAQLASGPEGSDTGAQEIICKGGDQAPGSYRLLQIRGSQLSFSVGQWWLWYDATCELPLQTGHWYHIAGTYDGQTVRLYVDGDLRAAKDVGRIPVGNGSPLYFSFHDAPGYPYYLTGEMDDVRLWNYARSEEEIRATMGRPLTGHEQGLVGYWKLEEFFSDQNVLDSSPSRSNGMLGSDPNPGGDDPVRVSSTAPVVSDTTPPVITCTDKTITIAPPACAASCPSVATAIDDCDPSPVVTQVPAVGACLELGAHTVAASATDANGNSATCTATVTVVGGGTQVTLGSLGWYLIAQPHYGEHRLSDVWVRRTDTGEELSFCDAWMVGWVQADTYWYDHDEPGYKTCGCELWSADDTFRQNRGYFVCSNIDGVELIFP